MNGVIIITGLLARVVLCSDMLPVCSLCYLRVTCVVVLLPALLPPLLGLGVVCRLSPVFVLLFCVTLVLCKLNFVLLGYSVTFVLLGLLLVFCVLTVSCCSCVTRLLLRFCFVFSLTRLLCYFCVTWVLFLVLRAIDILFLCATCVTQILCYVVFYSVIVLLLYYLVSVTCVLCAI